NIIAPTLVVFLIKVIYDKGQTENITANFGYFSFPGLSSIPIVGPIFFKNTSAPAWIAIILAILMWWILYKTRFGLRLRSCGENPQAADTMGNQCLWHALCRCINFRLYGRSWRCRLCSSNIW